MLNSLKNALASFPSGVVIATTRDRDGKAWGFTASSFCAVSLNPPIVSVCLALAAECHAAFEICERINFNILSTEDDQLATRFATRGGDKFAGGGFVDDPWGLPVWSHSVAVLSCARAQTIPCGDHVILLGDVNEVDVREGRDSIVYYRRSFGAVHTPTASMA